jgi:ABC-type nitrate/sulfonate/bicarbonate transport system ATPase subunit
VKRIETVGVWKTFGGKDVLSDVSVCVDAGKVVALLGPSGCGKSTLLSLLSGFERPSRGDVLIGGARVERPHPRRILLFQDGALLPWRTALENVAFGLEAQGWRTSEARERAAFYLALVGLSAFGKQLPRQLSGGQRQRVALARALSVEPEVLFLDEPFSALDTLNRERLQDELLQIVAQHGTTVVLVTHDVEEALYLADTCYLLAAEPGRIVEAVAVGLPRWRVRGDGKLLALKQHVLQRLESAWSPSRSLRSNATSQWVRSTTRAGAGARALPVGSGTPHRE